MPRRSVKEPFWEKEEEVEEEEVYPCSSCGKMAVREAAYYRDEGVTEVVYRCQNCGSTSGIKG